MKVQVDIFSGFLGAGKTMLIKKLLAEKAYGKNTVILENEFGEVGIDGEILKESNIQIKEINSGCICCQVSGDFGEAIVEIIKKYSPDNIIIEPSGVAKVSEILNILNRNIFESNIEVRNVLTLIDVKNYDIYIRNFKEFYENQIRKADKIVLSRTQFVDNVIIENTIKSIKKYNSKAEILYKPWEKLRADDFLKKNNKEVVFIKTNYNTAIKKRENQRVGDVFESYKINIIKSVSIREIEKSFELISSCDKFGSVIRAKGIFKCINGRYYQFDYVPHEFKSREIIWSDKNVVSIIGSKLDKKELSKLFK